MFFKNSHKLQAKTFLNAQVIRNSTTNVKIKQNVISDDYQFIQKSSLPTLHFQKSLLRLPIPELNKTCERYLNALKPILSENQYEKTKILVQNFKENEGQSLQEALKLKDSLNKHTSYISKPWFDMYLKDRSPLPLNYNPGIAFKRSNHSNAESQLCKATNMTISSLRFMKSLNNNYLAPEVFHLNPNKTNTDWFNVSMRLLPSMIASYGAYLLKVKSIRVTEAVLLYAVLMLLKKGFKKAYPLDMSQYSSLFSSTRIPQEGKDILVKDRSGKHIVVLRKGHFFLVDVLDETGNILPPEDIFTSFKYILSEDLKPNQNSIGILTTENRDIWARARQHLVSIHPDNFQSIKAIDAALFVVCLDEKPLNNPVEMMRCFLHGDGSNRWFDKSFSLIISGDGLAAVNFEHSWGDGVAVLRYIKEVFEDVNKNPFVDSSTEVSKTLPKYLARKLDIHYDEKVFSDVKTAKEKFDKICGSLGINAVEFEGLGRSLCKKAKISPDALMQLSFQIAYHKVFGKFVSTYESCSTAAFKHGRTETLRPCTEATRNVALKLNTEKNPDKEELFHMIKQCSEIHKILTKEAAMGQGFDRHLFGLKHINDELGNPLPELYKDEAYKLINYNILSTSTLAADEVLLGGFGPVVPDGYGVGYTILDNYCGSIVTSYPAIRDGADFAKALESVFGELSILLNCN